MEVFLEVVRQGGFSAARAGSGRAVVVADRVSGWRSGWASAS